MKKINFSFDLFGFDFIPLDSIFSIWFCEVKEWNYENARCLFAVHFDGGEIVADILFFRFVL